MRVSNWSAGMFTVSAIQLNVLRFLHISTLWPQTCCSFKRLILDHLNRSVCVAAGLTKYINPHFPAKLEALLLLSGYNIDFKHISTLCDPNGRYIIVTGHLYSLHVTLLNIYGPNIDEPAFFRKTFEKLPDLSNTNLIVAGDHNVILDSHLDRSASRICNPSNASTVLNNLIASTNLVDIWRLHHPTDRKYSFFLNKHKSYSRIHFFLLDAKLISNVTNTKYYNILISDHAPTSMTFNFSKPKPGSSWHFRPSLLADKNF